MEVVDEDEDPGFLARDTPERPHVLIAFESAHHPQLAAVARMMADCLEHAGVIADVADASQHAMPVPPDYELVIVGISLRRLGHHAILRWVESVSSELRDVPSAVFILRSRRDASLLWERIASSLGWRPIVVDIFPPMTSTRRAVRVIEEFVQRLTPLFRNALPASTEVATGTDRR